MSAAMLTEGGLTPTAFFHPATIALEIALGLAVAIGGLMARLETSLFFKNVAVRRGADLHRGG